MTNQERLPGPGNGRGWKVAYFMILGMVVLGILCLTPLAHLQGEAALASAIFAPIGLAILFGVLAILILLPVARWIGKGGLRAEKTPAWSFIDVALSLGVFLVIDVAVVIVVFFACAAAAGL